MKRQLCIPHSGYPCSIKITPPDTNWLLDDLFEKYLTVSVYFKRIYYGATNEDLFLDYLIKNDISIIEWLEDEPISDIPHKPKDGN